MDSKEYVKIFGSSKSASKTDKTLSTGEGITISPTPKSILNGVLVLPILPMRLTLIPLYSLSLLITSRFLI